MILILKLWSFFNRIIVRELMLSPWAESRRHEKYDEAVSHLGVLTTTQKVEGKLTWLYQKTLSCPIKNSNIFKTTAINKG